MTQLLLTTSSCGFCSIGVLNFCIPHYIMHGESESLISADGHFFYYIYSFKTAGLIPLAACSACSQVSKCEIQQLYPVICHHFTPLSFSTAQIIDDWKQIRLNNVNSLWHKLKLWWFDWLPYLESWNKEQNLKTIGLLFRQHIVFFPFGSPHSFQFVQNTIWYYSNTQIYSISLIVIKQYFYSSLPASRSTVKDISKL